MTRTRERRGAGIVAILVLTIAAAVAGVTAGAFAATPARPARGTEILWDQWGVPHLYAPDEASLCWASGWAQAHAHANLLLRLYGEARGRAAEYWGEDALVSDRWIRTMGVPARGERWIRELSPARRRLIESFAAGINAYANAHRDEIADSLEVALPVRAADVAAHVQRVILFEFVSRRDVVEADIDRWSRTGSNAWAIAPKRSASGHALLLANPHLPWFGPFTWFEMQLVAPGLDGYGVALVGLPFLGIGFNQQLGWTHTNNPIDNADLYALTLGDGGYRWNGAWRPFDTAVETLRVRTTDGHLRAEPLTIRRSIHGPVVRETEGKAVALRVAGLDRSGLLFEHWDLMHARDLAGFEKVLARLDVPYFNVMYADRAGHILYVFNGRLPVRDRGGVEYWAGVVPGDSSATLWTDVHPYRQLPRALDPPSGWLQNANDPPWTATLPPVLDASRFPAYLADRSFGFRPQRSVRMLEADSSFTLEELIAAKHSTREELADHVVDPLLALARARGTERARRAADVLGAWDRSADSASRGAVLFEAFWRDYRRRVPGRAFEQPWSPADALDTPRGLAAPDSALAALDAAAEQVERERGRLDVAFGDVYRLQRDGLDLPGNGSASAYGVFRVTHYSPAGGGKFRAIAGDSWVAAIEFGDTPRALALLGYGNASQPGSPHRTDQLSLYARKALRDVWTDRARIEDHLERRERF